MNDLFAGLYADGKIFESSCAQRRQACDRIALTPILSPKLSPKFRTVLEICDARKMCARKKKAWHEILSKYFSYCTKFLLLYNNTAMFEWSRVRFTFDAEV